MRGSNKYGLIAGMVVLCLNLFSCKFSGKKDAGLMGKWDKTESAGVGATLAERCEFFEDQKFVWTIKDLSNPNISTLVTGTYKIEKDSFFLYDEKKPKDVWNRSKITFLSDDKMVLTTTTSTVQLEKKK